MLSLMNDCPFLWITPSRYIGCELNSLVHRELMATLVLVFGKHYSWIDLDSQSFLAHSHFFLFYPVLAVKKSANLVKSLKLIECVIDDESP